MRIGFTGSHIPDEVKSQMSSYLVGKGYTLDMLKMHTRNAYNWKEQLKPYSVIISAGETYSEETLSYLKDELLFISRFGAGYDEIDVDSATKLGIAIASTPGKMSTAVAEAALLMILNLLRDFPRYDNEIRMGQWNRRVDRQLSGKTIGLVGFGSISRKLAEYLSVFSCRILAWDKSFNQEVAASLSVEQCTIEEMLQQSDVISLHVPANTETKGMVDEQFLERMKKTAYLINTSRGSVVNEGHLIGALEKGVIAGAGLDVFEHEPISPGNPLTKMKNVILTPHIAASTIEGYMECGLTAVENVIQFLEGNDLPNIINPDYINVERKMRLTRGCEYAAGL